MTDCLRYEHDLKAYADGELSWLRRRAVRRHLTRCASCREEIAAMTQMTEDLRVSELEEALPPDLRAKILAHPGTGSAGLLLSGSASGTEDASVAERLSLPNRPALPVPGPSPRKRPALAWSLAGAALVAWFLLFPLFQRTQSVPDTLAGMRPTQAPTAVFRNTANQQQMKAFNRSVKVPPPPDVSAPPAMAAAPVPAGRAAPLVALPDSVIAPDGGADPLRQVHKEASIGVQVRDPEATGDAVSAMVKEAGGYVAANNLSTGDDGLKTGELIVKVPVAQFETFLAQVAKLGVVQSKNISGEDITEKTSDADQAEGVLEDDVQQSEARLRALGRNAKWRDEQATRDLRTQLAQAQARLVLLKRLAALGTVTIDLSQTPKAVPAAPVTGGFLGGLRGTTRDALQSLVGSAGALLALVIWLLAYAPLWVPLLLVGRYGLKEYRRRAA